jgi:hypothetical protein
VADLGVGRINGLNLSPGWRKMAGFVRREALTLNAAGNEAEGGRHGEMGGQSFEGNFA